MAAFFSICRKKENTARHGGSISVCLFWTIIIQINHEKSQSPRYRNRCVFRRKRSCLCLEFSNYQLFPVTFLGSVRAVTVVMRGKDNSVLTTLNIQGSVELDEEFNNVRVPLLSTYAGHPVFSTSEGTKWKSFYWDPTSQHLAQQGGAWPGPVTAGPTLASCGKIAALQLHASRNAIPHLPCRHPGNYGSRKSWNHQYQIFVTF